VLKTDFLFRISTSRYCATVLVTQAGKTRYATEFPLRAFLRANLFSKKISDLQVSDTSTMKKRSVQSVSSGSN
jgi:hypothetical protein